MRIAPFFHTHENPARRRGRENGRFANDVSADPARENISSTENCFGPRRLVARGMLILIGRAQANNEFARGRTRS